MCTKVLHLFYSTLKEQFVLFLWSLTLLTVMEMHLELLQSVKPPAREMLLVTRLF